MESYWTVSVRVTTFGIKTSLPLWVCGLFISDRLNVFPCLPVKRHLSTTIYQSNGYYWHQDKVDRKRDTSSSEIERERKKETSLQDTTKSYSQRAPAVWQIPHQIISWLPFLFKRSRWLWRAWRAANVYRINEGELRLRHRQVEPQENLICIKTPQRSHRIRHISLPTYASPPLSHVLFFILRLSMKWCCICCHINEIPWGLFTGQSVFFTDAPLIPAPSQTMESQWRAGGIGWTWCWPACCLEGSDVSMVSGLKATVPLERTMLSLVILLQEMDREGLWEDGDSGSDTEGVEDRRARWHSDVIKYSKTGTSWQYGRGQTAVRPSLPLPCLKKRSNNTWNQQRSDCLSTLVKSHIFYCIQMYCVYVFIYSEFIFKKTHLWCFHTGAFLWHQLSI